jgi:hypothetical protein
MEETHVAPPMPPVHRPGATTAVAEVNQAPQRDEPKPEAPKGKDDKGKNVKAKDDKGKGKDKDTHDGQQKDH